MVRLVRSTDQAQEAQALTRSTLMLRGDSGTDTVATVETELDNVSDTPGPSECPSSRKHSTSSEDPSVTPSLALTLGLGESVGFGGGGGADTLSPSSNTKTFTAPSFGPVPAVYKSAGIAMNRRASIV